MKYRTASLFFVAALMLATRPLSASGEQPVPGKPNIIYIMADELGYYELSCMGHPHIQTPHIDQLAAEGIRFTQALAGSSLCAPTRACLMTGKHSGHTSVRTNGGGTPLRAEEKTIASVLNRAGYATGGFGKWGCGGRGSTGVPEQHGFDIFFGYYDQVHAHSYYPGYLIQNSEEYALAGNQGGRSGETYSHYVIMGQAMEFIRAHQANPFFCYLPITPPHGMFDIPDADPAWARYRDEPWPEEARRYAAMVSMVDRQVGELLDLLEELKLRDNTIIFFCGDNGGVDYFKSGEYPRGFHAPNVDPESGVAFRGHKGNLYEGGLRIPMMVNWPNHIRPGRISDHLWYFPDVLPTLAELAGAEIPEDTDGLSILPELLGQRATGRVQEKHEYLYWELGRQTAVRKGNWKAIRPTQNADWELYDLDRDITESNNIAGAHPDLLARMTAFADRAHTPVREGAFGDRARHEQDRRAKWGNTKGPATELRRLPPEGLLPNQEWHVTRVSSESRSNGKLAGNAIDGDPSTLWHTRWQGELARHPHELVIDLGRVCTIRGFRYLARQDAGWNGSLKVCEFYVGERAEISDLTPIKATFAKTREAQEVTCKPRRGRYVTVRILSEISDGPWASIAELGVVGEP